MYTDKMLNRNNLADLPFLIFLITSIPTKTNCRLTLMCFSSEDEEKKARYSIINSFKNNFALQTYIIGTSIMTVYLICINYYTTSQNFESFKNFCLCCLGLLRKLKALARHKQLSTCVDFICF